MGLNTAQNDAIAYRQQEVARLRLRGLSQREIVTTLAGQGLVNPDTTEPYSLGTVNADVQALKRQWRSEAQKVTASHRAGLLAELREVRRTAWQGAAREDVVAGLVKALEDGDPGVRAAAARSLGAVGMPDLASILKAAKQEADLLGLDAPTKVEATGKDGGAIVITAIEVVRPDGDGSR